MPHRRPLKSNYRRNSADCGRAGKTHRHSFHTYGPGLPGLRPEPLRNRGRETRSRQGSGLPVPSGRRRSGAQAGRVPFRQGLHKHRHSPFRLHPYDRFGPGFIRSLRRLHAAHPGQGQGALHRPRFPYSEVPARGARHWLEVLRHLFISRSGKAQGTARRGTG